jgi:hypothetical protein
MHLRDWPADYKRLSSNFSIPLLIFTGVALSTLLGAEEEAQETKWLDE